MKTKSVSKASVVIGLIWVSGLMSPLEVLAMGKGASNSAAPKNYTQPDPVRPVVLSPVEGVKPFTLPNQVTTDLNADLNGMFRDAVSISTNFVPTEQTIGTPETCNSSIRITASVTDFTLDALEIDGSISYTFGYSQTGGINPGTPQVQGKTKVKIGSLTMGFGVWKCSKESCALLITAEANQTAVGSDTTFDVLWSDIHGGGEIISKTKLGPMISKIMNSGLHQLSLSPRLAELPWYAVVLGAGDSPGTYRFSAGQNDRLVLDNYFSVYAKVDGSSACDTFDALACVHANRIDLNATQVAVDSMSSLGFSRGIKLGDIVMMGPSRCALPPGSAAGGSAISNE